MQLVDRVRQTILRHDLARPDTRVLAALSGGPDSMALACVLADLAAGGRLRLVGLAHFNHQLRPAADDDEKFCERAAAAFGLPFVAGREAVEDLRRRERRSLEDAARDARYRFLERARREIGADVVALGHTRDDQAETFLLRLVRGAGLRGLASMHPRRGVFVRPLLDCRRQELVAHLESRDVDYLVDESNRDVSIPRNRVRAKLLPLLAARFNPAIVDALANEADLAREAWTWMRGEAQDAAARICTRAGDRQEVDALELARLPEALALFVMHELMAEASAGRVTYRQVKAAVDLARGNGADFDAPGHRVERLGDRLVLTGRPAGRGRRAPRPVNLFRYSLSIPGEVVLSEASCIVSAEPLEAGGRADAVLGTDAVAVSRKRCPGPLSVRNRRPGDRFRPPGLAGRKKLQDYFVDMKIDRFDRDRVPLVVDEQDRIVWVAGHAIDADFRVTDPAQAMIILRLKVLGGPA